MNEVVENKCFNGLIHFCKISLIILDIIQWTNNISFGVLLFDFY